MRILLLAFFLAHSGSYALSQITPLAQKWVARYNSPQNRDDFSSVVVTDAVGDLYVSGYAADAQGLGDVRVVKYRGATGERVWEWQGNTPRYYLTDSGGPAVVPLISRLAIGPDGDPVLMAQIGSGYSVGYEQRVLKLRASDGSLLWESARLSDTSALYCLAVDSNGDVVVGGLVNGRGGTMKYSGSNGLVLWLRQFGTSEGYSTPAVRAVRVDQSGNVLVTGYDYITPRYRAYTAKYGGTDGAVRWEQRITDPTYNRRGRELALDPSGNAIVALDDGLLCKYAAGDGLQLWQRSGTASYVPYELLVDEAGDTYVVSNVSTYTYQNGARLEKIAGSTGTLRWSATGPFFSSLLMRGGEVLVAGQIYSSSDDFLLAAFDPASGAQRWTATYGGNLADRLSSTYRSRGRIALQPDGGVVMTGCSQGATTGFDFATLRYAPGPGVKAGGIGWVLPTSARLIAQARDNRTPATIAWEYGSTTAYDQTTPPQNIALNSTTTFFPYTATIIGLPQNTTFHARAVASSSAGITYGEDFTFTTGWDANGDHLPDEWELAVWGNTNARSSYNDEDRDGLTNLLEYALGQNPRVADSRGAIPIALVGEYLSALVTKRPHVTCIVEASSDLRTWSADETVVVFEDAAAFVVRDTVPASSGISRFLRIRVIAQ